MPIRKINVEELIKDLNTRRWSVPLVLWIGSFFVYFLTLIKEPFWGDSAELSLQAYQLGVTHAPGYPVHTFLGKLFGLVIPDPAIATALLSAICTCFSVAILSYLVLEQTKNVFASFFAGMLLAFSPQIWEFAVTTEIYNVNLVFFAFVVLLTYKAIQKHSWWWIAATAAVFGVSLGTYLANLLFLPGFWLSFFLLPQIGKTEETTSEDKKHNPVYVSDSIIPWNGINRVIFFTIVAGIFGLLIVSWSMIRSSTLPPLGTSCLPLNIQDAWCYFSGSQYGSTMLQNQHFYMTRIGEHLGIFSRNLGYAGILFGIFGFVAFWLTRKSSINLLWPLLCIFIIDMVYFTGYRAFDYHTMVAPAYFIYVIWVGWGLASINRIVKPPAFRFGIRLVFILTILFLFVSQAPPRFNRSKTTPILQTTMNILESAPPDAILVTDWSKFTVLVYLQKINGIRPDISVVELNKFLRYYDWGETVLEDYLADNIHDRPIYFDGWDPSLDSKYHTSQNGFDDWLLLTEN